MVYIINDLPWNFSTALALIHHLAEKYLIGNTLVDDHTRIQPTSQRQFPAAQAENAASDKRWEVPVRLTGIPSGGSVASQRIAWICCAAQSMLDDR